MVDQIFQHIGNLHFYLTYLPLVFLLFSRKRKSKLLIVVVIIAVASGVSLQQHYDSFSNITFLHGFIALLFLGTVSFTINKNKLIYVLLFLTVLSGVYSHYGKSFFYSTFESDENYSSIIKSKQLEIYQSIINPLLHAKCLSCHNASNNSGGINLDNISHMYSKNRKMPIITPFDAYKSALYLSIIKTVDDSKHMPKHRGMLSVEDIKSIKDWINNGALSFNEHFKPASSNVYKKKNRLPWFYNKESDQSFKSLDSYYFSILDKNNIDYNSEKITKNSFDKKLSLSVTGMIPLYFNKKMSINDLLQEEEFLHKRLIKWLDYTSYFEEFKNNSLPKKYIEYKNNVIQSVRGDESYFNFFKEQFATLSSSIDNSSYKSFYNVQRINNESEESISGIDDTTQRVFQISSGLNISCAKCHDHKVLPISNEDYYSQVLNIGKWYSLKQLPSYVENHKHRALKGRPIEARLLTLFDTPQNKEQSLVDYLTDTINGVGFYTARQYVDLVFKSLTGKSFINLNEDYLFSHNNSKLLPILNWLTTKFINEGLSTKLLVKRIVKSKLFTHDIATDQRFELQRRQWLTLEEYRDNVLLLTKNLNGKSLFIIKNNKLSLGHKIKNKEKYSRSVYFPRNGDVDSDLFKKEFNVPNGDVSIFDRKKKATFSTSLAFLNKDYFGPLTKRLVLNYNITKYNESIISVIYQDFFNRKLMTNEKNIWKNFFKVDKKNNEDQANMFFHILLTSDEFLTY